LVNLIAEKEVVKELIQANLTTENLISELQKILPNGSKHTQILTDYAQVRHVLGDKGASERAGRLMVQYLQESVVS
jgi:lipid-A-disaccharide synthase